MARITKEDAEQIIRGMKQKGAEVGLRDISYILLCRTFEDKIYAFRSVFGDAAPVPFAQYSISSKVQDLQLFMDSHYPAPKDDDESLTSDVKETLNKEKEDEGLSYDEVKRGMEDDLKRLISLRDDMERWLSGDEPDAPKVDPKDYTTIVAKIADIRVKLTDKFGTTKNTDTQRVIVRQKYDAVCPYCGREVAIGLQKT